MHSISARAPLAHASIRAQTDAYAQRPCISRADLAQPSARAQIRQARSRTAPRAAFQDNFERGTPDKPVMTVNGYAATSPRAWEAMSRRLQASQSLGWISPDDVERLLASRGASSVAIIDVRAENEYKTGTVPGAVSVPVFQLIQVRRKRMGGRRATPTTGPPGPPP